MNILKEFKKHFYCVSIKWIKAIKRSLLLNLLLQVTHRTWELWNFHLINVPSASFAFPHQRYGFFLVTPFQLNTIYNYFLKAQNCNSGFIFSTPFFSSSAVLSSLFQHRGILGKAAGGFKCRRSHLDLHAPASNSFTVHKLPL